MITWYRFLDWLQSAWNRSRKALNGHRRYGPEWRDRVRSGRHYSRVEFSPIGFGHGEIDIRSAPALHAAYRIRREPGWEWTCFNCRTHSIVLASMEALWTVENETFRTNMLQEWEDLARNTAARGFTPPVRPTPATASCPNCKGRPGAPE